MRRIAILGSTGSIGVNVLDVVARHPQRYAVAALAANVQWEKLLEQCLLFRPRVAALLDDAAAEALRAALRRAGSDTEVWAGADGVARIGALADADTVVAAIVGAAGLASTLAAARHGKRILLANKETLVLAGEWFMRTAREHHATVLPLDSEHNAIFQCLPSDYAQGARAGDIHRLILTASGGPFRTRPLAELDAVTPEQACAHPNWVMGRKISVDSATMMNKGLEVIEARWLFGLPAERISVVIHPQSIVHSLVEYIDGSQLAQLGSPDMRTPIAHALAYPERIDSGVQRLDLAAVGRLDFTAPDLGRFPCLRLGFEALRAGGSAPGALNAANEIAVAAFLDRQLRYTDIPRVCEDTLARVRVTSLDDLEAVIACDDGARELAREAASRFHSRRAAQ
ncbi:MAG: 1-deoxy-D-xylulose-5-phosphate reductoisomerase [Betaproteobacteria bacterium]|nr:1-deoxy-D-xylulose-5-phosphate reductoisomerase [Betaproteobacteria bacterium]